MSTIGRPCSVCSSADISAITNALSLGASVSTVSKRYGLSESALFRHQRNHRPNTIPVLTLQQYAQDSSDIASRIREIADDARNLRRAGMHTGNSLAATRAAQSEMAALQLLSTQLGIDDTRILEALSETNALIEAVVAVAGPHRKVATALLAELKSRDAKVAGEFEQLIQYVQDHPEQAKEIDK